MSKVLPLVPVAVFAIALGATSIHAQDAASVVRLEARPATVTVTAGESVAFNVVALDAGGDVVDVGIRIAPPRQAASYRDGVLQGLTPGEYQIVATLAGGQAARCR